MKCDRHSLCDKTVHSRPRSCLERITGQKTARESELIVSSYQKLLSFQLTVPGLIFCLVGMIEGRGNCMHPFPHTLSATVYWQSIGGTGKTIGTHAFSHPNRLNFMSSFRQAPILSAFAVCRLNLAAGRSPRISRSPRERAYHVCRRKPE